MDRFEREGEGGGCDTGWGWGCMGGGRGGGGGGGGGCALGAEPRCRFPVVADVGIGFRDGVDADCSASHDGDATMDMRRRRGL